MDPCKEFLKLDEELQSDFKHCGLVHRKGRVVLNYTSLFLFFRFRGTEINYWVNFELRFIFKLKLSELKEELV